MNDPFEWYVTQDEEAWRLAVGAETREAAIEFGRNEYGCESFMICEARKGHFRVGMDATDLEEWVLNNCEDQLGEDQDGILLWPKELYDFRRPFDAKGQPIDAAEIERRKQVNARRNLISADLRAMQEATVYAWAAKHGIEIDRPWMFAETRSEERMPVIEGAEQFGTPS